MVYRVTGTNFNQMYMNTNLELVRDHPQTEIVGVCDEEPNTSTGSLDRAVTDLNIPNETVFNDLDRSLSGPILDPGDVNTGKVLDA